LSGNSNVRSAFARELEAPAPQVVTAVHVAGAGLDEASCGGPQAGFFYDATGGWSAAMAAKSWMTRLRRVASQARHTWLGGMSLTRL
jgi:hypothetical protein